MTASDSVILGQPGLPMASIIVPGSRVRLHLAIYLSDGTEVLSTLGEEPLDFILGDGTLTPGTESLLLGLAAGMEEGRLAKGEDLFGTWRAEHLHWLSKASFPGEIPEPGSLVAFDTPDGNETAGIVLEIQADRVKVDFNHPLANRILRLSFRVLEVEEPDDNALPSSRHPDVF